MAKKSETVTENLFRDFYNPGIFIEKSAIPNEYGFKSKNGTLFAGYPDFFSEQDYYVIIVEAKADNHRDAQDEVKHYMLENSICKDIVGIAVSGQTREGLKVSYYLKLTENDHILEIETKDTLLSIERIRRLYIHTKYGDKISTEELITKLKRLNEDFNENKIVEDTDRSLFFSGIMIALTNNHFRNIYKNAQQPSKDERKKNRTQLFDSHYLNEAIIDAIATQLEGKLNSKSKEYNWRDRFSFIKTIDFPLPKYKKMIGDIEDKIYIPFRDEEKQDILGRAYKIFLSRTSSKIDNRNIILTPDHIKSLMIRLARLSHSDVILDTCTGSGAFLMEALETMVPLAYGDESKINQIKNQQLIGFEINSTLFALACSNMFLHGDGRTNLLFRSSLLNMQDQNDKEVFDEVRKFKPTKVIINPPYERNSPIKFTIQAMEYLEPNGKLIIIMPTPTLTHNQNGLTEDLLGMAKLDFVIKMPMKLFSEQKRTVNTSIFGFTKTAHDINDEVLFYKLDDDGLVSIQHKGRIDKFKKWNGKEDKIVESIRNGREIDDVCQKKRIYNSDGKLNCAGIAVKRNSNYEMVKISTLFKFSKGTLASDDCEDVGEYDFITASEEWKKHTSYALNQEALVYAVAAAGSLGRCHYVNGKFTASNLCYVLTDKHNPKYKVCVEFYKYYFEAIRNQIISDLADGTSKLTISKDNLKDYYIDYIPYKTQVEFIETKIKEYNDVKKRYIHLERKLKNSISSLL